jgi:predicted glycosyltransferase
LKVWVDCTAAAHPLVLRRSRRLIGWARGRGIDLALAHGSVDIAVVSRLLRIPLVQMNDYEHAGLQRRISFRAARRVLAPDAIPIEAMERAGARRDRLFRYPGLKEDYYLADFSPDEAVLGELGLERGRRLAVVRPPPETSEYHADNPLYEGVLDRLAAEDANTVVIPRTEPQRERLRERGSAPRSGGSGPQLVVPDVAIDAQSLIAYADLVVGAGGTMNREAVALGTPVMTFFSGEMGAVDEKLIAEGRMRVLTDPAAIELAPREAGTGALEPKDPQLLADAVLHAYTGDTAI